MIDSEQFVGQYDIFERDDDGSIGPLVGTISVHGDGHVEVLTDTRDHLLFGIFDHARGNPGTSALRIFCQLQHHSYYIVRPHRE